MAASKKKSKYDSLKYLTLLTQLGISVITPILLCAWLATFLGSRYGLAQNWQLLLLLFGVGGAASNIINFFRYAYKEAKRSEEQEGED